MPQPQAQPRASDVSRALSRAGHTQDAAEPTSIRGWLRHNTGYTCRQDEDKAGAVVDWTEAGPTPSRADRDASAARRRAALDRLRDTLVAAGYTVTDRPAQWQDGLLVTGRTGPDRKAHDTPA